MKNLNREESILEAQKLISDGKLEEARSMIEAIKEEDSKQELEAKEEKKEVKEEVKEDPKDEQIKDEEVKKEDKEVLEDDVKKELEELKNNEERKAPKGEERKMEKIVLDGKEVAGEKNEVRGFVEFVKTKGAERRGVTTVDAEAIIPVDVITKARMLPETVVDLRKMVNEVAVTTGSGSYPILLPNKAILTSVEELAKNPELAAPQFEKVNYEVATYRGQIPVSEEALQDSDDNLAGIIANHIQRQGLNTTNAQIAAEMKKATAKTIKGLDDLKTLLNVTIEPAYNVKLVMSQSFFNAIDQMKDNEGRYLLQQDITVASGYKLFGREVVILADTLIGSKAGDKVAFVGSPEDYVTMFKRAETTARWIDHEIYGQLLAIFMRFDVEIVDENAGFYVTLTPEESGGVGA